MPDRQAVAEHMGIFVSTLLRLAYRIKSLPDRDIMARIVADPLAMAERYRRELRRTLESVPYYRPHLDRPLEEFPVLTKDLLREHNDELIARAPSCGRRWNSSGGSTGVPVRLVQDSPYRRFSNIADVYVHARLFGLDPRPVSKVMIWGAERDILDQRKDLKRIALNRIKRLYWLNAFRLDAATLETAIRDLRARRPEYVRGYASALEAVARFALERGLDLPHPGLVVSSAEVLHPFQKALIEEAFGAPVRETYGSRECSGLAGQCSHGRHHLMLFNHFVEVVDEGGRPAPPGTIGRVLATTLHNRAMPLVRYELGDMAEVGEDPCPCGNPLPTLTRIVGRVTDNFIAADGSVVHGEFFTHLLYFKDYIRRFQVVQEDVNRIILRVEPADEVSFERNRATDLEAFRDGTHKVMGPECKVELVTGGFETTPTGKHRFTISRVAR